MTRRAWRGCGLVLRVAATVGVVGGCLGLAVGDAAAATGVTIKSPADNAVITDTSTPSLTVQASADGSICRIDMKVSPSGGQPPPPTTSTSFTPPGRPTTATTYTWAPQLPANGPYQLDVTVQTSTDPFCQFPGPTQTATRNFSLAVKPAPPAGVTAAANPDRTVKVDWKANSEPDIVGYSVFRVAKGKTCAAPVAADRIATTTTTPSYTDTFGSADPGGDYCYTVEATRKGATADTTIDSAPSTAATATVTPSPTGATGGSGSGSGIVTNGTGTETSSGAAPGSPPGTGAGAAATGSAPRSGGGPLDLGFSALVQKVQRPAANRPGAPAAEPDGGFLPTLPFKKNTTVKGGDVTVGDDSTNVLSEGGSNDRVRVLGAVAAGLLALVVVGHLLLLRREVNRIPALESMEPSAGAAGSSG